MHYAMMFTTKQIPNVADMSSLDRFQSSNLINKEHMHMIDNRIDVVKRKTCLPNKTFVKIVCSVIRNMFELKKTSIKDDTFDVSTRMFCANNASQLCVDNMSQEIKRYQFLMFVQFVRNYVSNETIKLFKYRSKQDLSLR